MRPRTWKAGAGMLCAMGMLSCNGDPGQGSASADRFATERAAMVEEQLVARGIRDPRVLAAMGAVPRERFVPESARRHAYGDHAMEIGEDQTISQPYVVAFMTEALGPQASDKVLEVGTGSGYQAAVLAGLVRQVFTIEILEPLAKNAEKALRDLAISNVQVRVGDGYRGWPEQAPFDKIIVTCAPDHVPPALVAQLKEGGRMVLPVGDQFQELVLLTRTGTGTTERRLLPVRFVPMTGEAEKGR